VTTTASDVRAGQARRFAYLKFLYDDAQTLQRGNLQSVERPAIAVALGITEDEGHRIETYLAERSLIEFVGGSVGLTAAGMDYVEAAIVEPDEPTEYFPPINVLHIEQVTNSQIQQGTIHSTQTGEWAGPLDVPRVTAAITDLRQAIADLPLAVRGTADANLATIQAQVSSPRPSFAIIRESVGLVRDVLTGAGAGVTLAEKLPPLLHALGMAVGS
jgi:hypothetical protein